MIRDLSMSIAELFLSILITTLLLPVLLSLSITSYFPNNPYRHYRVFSIIIANIYEQNII